MRKATVDVNMRNELYRVIREALPEYGCTDYGTFPQQADFLTDAVLDFLSKKGV